MFLPKITRRDDDSGIAMRGQNEFLLKYLPWAAIVIFIIVLLTVLALSEIKTVPGDKRSKTGPECVATQPTRNRKKEYETPV